MGTSPTFKVDRYDANSANVNRQITFRVAPDAADPTAVGTFLALKGPANQYPHYHQIQGATDIQELAQLRLSLVVRAMTTYAIPVGVHVDPANGEWVDIKYEQDEMGVFFNQDWTGNPALPKHADDGTPAAGTADWITDTVGVGGMPRGPKEKRGLNLLLAELATVSFDGGTSTIFGNPGGASNVTLPDGSVVGIGVAGVPALVAGAYASGLVATWIGY